MYYRQKIEKIGYDEVMFLIKYYTEDSIEDTDELLELKGRIKKLPWNDKIIFVLMLDGHTTRAVGKFLGCSAMTVSRGYREIKKRLKDV